MEEQEEQGHLGIRDDAMIDDTRSSARAEEEMHITTSRDSESHL